MPKKQTPLFGAHMSIAGGYERAVIAAAAIGFDCVQLFSKNSNQWKAKPISESEAGKFQAALHENGISKPLIHDSYLINLGTGKGDLYEKSLEAFAEELRRAAALGVENLVMHPGTPTGDESVDPETGGLKRIAAALDSIFKAKDNNVCVLLETTAGQGTNLGWKFEHLRSIIDFSAFPERFGVCLDTAHIFAAGYPLIEKKDYEKTMREFDEIIGIERLKAFHLNDSSCKLGGRVDRHAQLGHGTLGLEPFRHIVNDPRFTNIPMYLETPKGTVEIDGEVQDWDAVNLELLRGLVR